MTGLEDRFMPPPQFADACDHLHDIVAAHVGADDFGPDDYLPGLRMLLLSMDYDARFSEIGRRVAWGEVFSALAARAWSAKAMKAHPGFDDRPVVAPVVITGMPRTGTTALHKLMAVDPQFQGLQTWLIAAPMPRPPRETWAANPRFRDQAERLNARFASQPDLRMAHDIVAEDVDECLGILRQGFVSNIWASAWPAANYDLWWRGRSERPSYEWFHRILRLIGGNEPEKRWLLKNPGHIQNLDLLFAMFPDARVIQTHRDPAKCVPSLCAILDGAHAVMEDERHDLHRRILGERETTKWADAIHAAGPVRQAYADQVLDVVHGDFHRDPLGVVERIYGFIGATLTPAVKAAMAGRSAAAPELSHGVHRYDLADFGLTADAVRERFGDYVERFGLVERRSPVPA